MSPEASLIDRSTPLLKERIRGVFRHLPTALAGDEEAIHQMRVAGRRLRVALPLLARKAGGRRVRRARAILRRLTRAAGTSRDLDVSVALLEKRPDGQASSPELDILLRRLRATRRRSRKRMVDALLDLEIARLRRDLRTVVRRRGEVLFTVVLRLRDARDARGGRILESLQQLGDHFEPVALHGLRKRLRRLRYAAELAEVVMGQTSEAPSVFKALQEQLGRIRDNYVLAEWLGRQAAAAQARGQEAMAVEARAQQAFFLEASHQEHRALLEQAPPERVRKGLEAMGQARTAA